MKPQSTKPKKYLLTSEDLEKRTDDIFSVIYLEGKKNVETNKHVEIHLSVLYILVVTEFICIGLLFVGRLF